MKKSTKESVVANSALLEEVNNMLEYLDHHSKHGNSSILVATTCVPRILAVMKAMLENA